MQSSSPHSSNVRTDDRASAVLTVDLAALAENWRILKARADRRCDVGAVLKADAYGLGLEPVAKTLARAGCTTFYVAHLEEGVSLRLVLGSAARIVVMHGPHQRTEAEFAAHRLVPVLNTPDQIAGWRNFSAKQDFLGECLVQIDTGMNRLGLTASEFSSLVDGGGLVGLYPAALMSHLACADQPDHPLNALQLARFSSALGVFRTKFPDAKASLANSAAIFLGPAFHHDLIRPGLALYGANPLLGQRNPMIPVIRLNARILQVRRVDQAAPVGYGATFSVPDGAKLATASIGYADGLSRAWGAVGHGFVDDIRVKIVGRLSMDLTIFDVTNVPDSSLYSGAFVEIIGAHQSVDEVGQASGSVAYEVLTSLGARYQRNYLAAPP